MLTRRLICLLVLIANVVSMACRHAAKPDLIVHHGRIVTVDANFKIVEAMAIKGDRIVAVGSNDEILALAGPASGEDCQAKT